MWHRNFITRAVHIFWDAIQTPPQEVVSLEANRAKETKRYVMDEIIRIVELINERLEKLKDDHVMKEIVEGLVEDNPEKAVKLYVKHVIDYVKNEEKENVGEDDWSINRKKLLNFFKGMSKLMTVYSNEWKKLDKYIAAERLFLEADLQELWCILYFEVIDLWVEDRQAHKCKPAPHITWYLHQIYPYEFEWVAFKCVKPAIMLNTSFYKKFKILLDTDIPNNQEGEIEYGDEHTINDIEYSPAAAKGELIATLTRNLFLFKDNRRDSGGGKSSANNGGNSGGESSKEDDEGPKGNRPGKRRHPKDEMDGSGPAPQAKKGKANNTGGEANKSTARLGGKTGAATAKGNKNLEIQRGILAEYLKENQQAEYITMSALETGKSYHIHKIESVEPTGGKSSVFQKKDEEGNIILENKVEVCNLNRTPEKRRLMKFYANTKLNQFAHKWSNKSNSFIITAAHNLVLTVTEKTTMKNTNNTVIGFKLEQWSPDQCMYCIKQ